MTETQYKELLKYCRDKRNYNNPDFKDKYALRVVALEIRRSITNHKTWIKNKMRILEITKNEIKIKQSLKDINDIKESKRQLIKQFAELKMEGIC